MAFYDITGNAPREIARWIDLPPVRGLRFDPTGVRLAVTSTDAAVAELRETATGRLLHRLPHPAAVMGADWSPDGSELATGSEDFQVRIWDAETGVLRHAVEGHHNVSVRPVYHPAGKILSTAGWDAVLRFWSARSGRLLFNGPACYDWQRFSADGSQLAVANYDGAVELYRVASTDAVRVFARSERNVAPALFLSVDFSPDSRQIVSSGSECLHLWDVASGKLTARIALPGTSKLTALFAADGASLVVADGDRSVTRCQLPTAQQTNAAAPETLVSGEGWEVSSRAADGRLVVVNRTQGVAEILSPDSSTLRRIGPHAALHNVAFCPDGARFATGTWQGTDIRIWDNTGENVLATLPVGENAFALWPSPHALVAVQMTEAALWLEDADGQWKRDRVWRPDPGQTFWVRAALSPDGRTLALPQSGDRIRLVTLATGEEFISLEPPKGFGLGLVLFSPDSRFLAAAGARDEVAVWDLPELRRELGTIGLDWTEP